MEPATHLDPELAAICAELPIFAFDWGPVRLDEIPSVRKAFETMLAGVEPLPMRTVISDHTVPGPKGAPDVTLRIYTPHGPDTERPCLYWIHGGGYIVGSALVDDPRLDYWADAFGCVVVSVDYRLAPETPFPGPLEDAYAGLVYLAGNAARFGVDPRRIVIGGASAGGGLCAGLALAARDRGEVPVTFQLLIYPMIDDRRTSPSANMTALGWTKEANLLGWNAYLGTEPGGADVSPYAAPARAEDLRGLPDAFIAVGTLDLFRDEDIDYALRLSGAGVETELHVYPGAPHAFESFAPATAIGARCQRDIDDALRGALARTARA